MLSEWLRTQTRGMVDISASALNKLGLTPNALTIIGTVFMFGIGFVLAEGRFLPAALLIVLAGAFDALDGGLARLTNRVTRFGAFLEKSSLGARAFQPAPPSWHAQILPNNLPLHVGQVGNLSLATPSTYSPLRATTPTYHLRIPLGWSYL